MTPLQILQDIITIARAIKTQVDLAKNNKEKLKTLANTMQLLVSSLEGVSDLPNNRQFVQSLTEFQTCIRDTQDLVIKITKMGKMNRFFYAQSNENDLNDCKQRIIEFIPLLNLGLNAQHLMDRDRDRRDAIADREAFIAQKERALKEAQAAAKMDQHERDAIILKQLASVRKQLEQQSPRSTPVSPMSPTTPVSPVPEELIVHLYDITFEQKLEESDLGSIYQGTWQDQPVTIKCFDHMITESEHKQLMREAQVMSRLHHESITYFYGACLDQGRPCLLTSVLEKGNLETNLASLSLNERLAMAKDLARGLAYLHGQAIIHGDIHPKHVGINAHTGAKWTNFGLAKIRAAGIASLPRVSQEAGWQAPESWQNRAELSSASDVYSFGMLLWTLVTGRLPYAGMTASYVMRHVQRGEREAIPIDVSRECRTLIEACWSTDVAHRPTAKQIVQQLSAMDFHTFRTPSPTGEEYYERGVASERAGNMVEAYQDYHRSSEKHFPKSLTSLGLFALQGLGGQTVDKKKAAYYLTNAADAGHPRAMFNLARMYEKGQTETGVLDYPKALFWYQKCLKSDPEDTRAAEKVAALSVLLNPVDSGYALQSRK